MSTHAVIDMLSHQRQPELTTVTPTLAEKLLSRNTHNRHLRQSTVERYARDMAAGNWLFTGHPIVLSENGTLLDGQHRLAAILRANVNLLMIVVRGVPVESQAAMDAGIGRTAADKLAFDGFQNASTLAAVAMRVVQWERRRPGVWSFSLSYKPTRIEVLDTARREEVRGAAGAAMRFNSIAARPSARGLAYYVCAQKDPEYAELFFTKVDTLHMLPASHPALVLAKKLRTLRTASTHSRDEDLLALFVRAWNAYRERRPLSLLRPRIGNCPFPEPK